MIRVVYFSNDFVYVQDSNDFKVRKVTYGNYNKMKSKMNTRQRYWSYEDKKYKITEYKSCISIFSKKTGKHTNIYGSGGGLYINNTKVYNGSAYPTLSYIRGNGDIKIICGKSIASIICKESGYAVCVNRYTNKKLKIGVS